MITDLATLKKHLMADDFTNDDDYITSLGEAAEMHVQRIIGRSVADIFVEHGNMLPPDLEHAIRLLVGHWYNQREAVSSASMNEVPLGMYSLLAPFRQLV